SIKSVLIDERDYYIARKIFETPGKKILAVVGAGHIKGIKKNLEKFKDNETLDERKNEEEKIKNLEKISSKERNLFSIIMYGFLGLIIILFAYALIFKGVDVFLNMTFTWIILHSTFSAIGAIIALANIRTIIASFIFSPFAAWHPGISIGMISALVEAKYNPPKVYDFENLSEIKFNKEGIKMIWKNRVAKIFLVFFLTNLGGSIATFVAGFSYINMLF
ncbi:MAG: TraB/GumN family protein, partial [Candidatus Altarchaeaceae archaeon]